MSLEQRALNDRTDTISVVRGCEEQHCLSLGEFPPKIGQAIARSTFRFSRSSDEQAVTALVQLGMFTVVAGYAASAPTLQ
jgi:hypothetical protein